MENTKIENISDIRLDFFLKQEKKDIRVILEPGDIAWCDLGSTTKSMILYARKNLIKIHDASKEVEKIIGISSESESESESKNFAPPVNTDEVRTLSIEQIKENFESAVKELLKVKNIPNTTIASELISVTPLSIPTGSLLNLEFITESTPIEKAEEEMKRYVSEEKEPKKYTGKKRGRKKKRGPKPGSKKKKESLPTMSEEKNDSSTISITGQTS